MVCPFSEFTRTKDIPLFLSKIPPFSFNKNGYESSIPQQSAIVMSEILSIPENLQVWQDFLVILLAKNNVWYEEFTPFSM